MNPRDLTSRLLVRASREKEEEREREREGGRKRKNGKAYYCNIYQVWVRRATRS